MLKPDYDTAAEWFRPGPAFEGGFKRAIDRACKPLYDRIAELEAKNERLLAALEIDGSRCRQLLRDLAVIEKYITDSSLGPIVDIEDVLVMVRQAQIGDTDAPTS